MNDMVYILAANRAHAQRHAHDFGIPHNKWRLVFRVDHLRAIYDVTIVVLDGYRLPVHVSEYREMNHYLNLVGSRNRVYKFD